MHIHVLNLVAQMVSQNFSNYCDRVCAVNLEIFV